MSAALTNADTESSGLTAPAWVDRQEYPFASHTLRLADGRRLHYLDEGSGDTVLFVHGTPTWSFEWRHVVRALSATHRCVAPDLLGFGLSDRPRDFPYTPEAHARVIAELVERLELRDVTLVVHDYGGPIALPLALDDRSRVRRLVVINSWMWSFDDDPDMARKARLAGGRLGRFLYRRLNFSLRVLLPHAYGDRGKLTPAIHAQYLAPFPDAWSRGAVLWPLARALLGSSAHYRRLWERRERLRRLPALIVWGTRDSAFEPRLLARWREALPEARVVELPVGHWPHEEAPAEVAAALAEFLSAPRA
ncbi:MAG TPA: alpha/beta fold hydrolase [Gemmatimonadaceae bacterium]|nr:alpha/beta fold hydrolase [Gemmatimonadaceae bacterium]